MKRIALYHPWIYLRGGAERVILEIARRSRHRYTIFTSYLDRGGTFPALADLPNLVELRRVPVERSFRDVLRAAFTIARQRLDLQGFNALLVSSEGVGDFITLRNHAKPVLCFCHTPVRPIYDPIYRREWLASHPGARLPLAVFSFLYQRLTRLAWRHYARVFVNSHEVAGRVLRGRLCAPERLEVLHPGVDTVELRPSGRQDRYFLYLGRIKWTKNVTLAIDAFRAFQRLVSNGGGAGGPWRLVVAGTVDAASRDYLAQLERRAQGEPAIEFRLDPTDSEVRRLYDACYALLYPSLNEDWGIVPLEAMAFAKPVVAVNQGGPTESVVHEQTGFLVEPRAERFADKMAWLAEQPEAATLMGRRGAERVHAYSWDAFVARLDEYVEQHC